MWILLIALLLAAGVLIKRKDILWAWEVRKMLKDRFKEDYGRINKEGGS